ncbi:DUF1684 domain-containing protein [Sediminibacterium soli]|uniref:DUF1684 domain-containing protein n=1 Tax=Sediminibacterium soli TaxID=2698829 RepID=UPI00137B8BCF|nr:DUF1684 domain-containing protein [Sediminibacterium soli]NCI45232.1 DUF1684 domain-containing protein [Sediminibacterium soli]
MKGIRIILLAMVLVVSAGTYAQEAAGYAGSIEQWHSERVEGLKKENGWLNLVGLYWLKPGKNYFGTDASNDIVFPKGSPIAAKAGYVEWEDHMVVLVPAENSGITLNKRSADRMASIVYHPDSARVPVAAAGSLRWSIIKRDEKLGIRLRDLNAAALASFKGIERYPADTRWKLEATLQTSGFPDRISITNVLGQTNLQKSAGKLAFTIDGRTYRLDALDEGDQLFVIFADQTNSTETYPSGRFLYVTKPDASGKTIIDFNKAYNPPCAFTEYATCPLPPKENSLPISITAGEKKYDTH